MRRRTTMPSQLQAVQNRTRRAYRIWPVEMRGQKTLVSSAGRMLNSATIPLGVEAGTRSSAADRMMT